MRVNEPSYFVGLTPQERRSIVLEAARLQNEEIQGLVGDLFSGVRGDTTRYAGPLADVAASIIKQNTPKTVSPANFWNEQERLRQERQRTGATSPGLGISSTRGAGLALTYGPKKSGTLAPAPLGGRSPVEFANSRGLTGVPNAPAAAVRPTLGVPASAPIKTITVLDLLGTQTDDQSITGQLIDLIA